jgi:hypothetical protein
VTTNTPAIDPPFARSRKASVNRWHGFPGSGIDKSLCLLGEVSPARGKTTRLIDVKDHVLPCSFSGFGSANRCGVIRDKLFRDEENSRGEFK